MDEPTPAGKYLGCDHKQQTVWILPGGNPMEPNAKGTIPVRMLEYDMEQFMKQCVERYQELAGGRGANLQRVATPFIDEATEPNVSEGQPVASGVLQPIASKVLMKILYAARMCRFDLLRATCALASLVTKWDVT